mmetsp:Transcript_7816/g.19398  ORF Transcript_7816/g.19398 Transcript_7816/m.19398 type:complete len:616 (-) Transcript_7816:86-1933(-)
MMFPPRYLIALTIIGVVDAISYMLVTPSLIFYVLRCGGTRDQYGTIMSAFSFSSFLTKPLIGWWSDRNGFRVPYLTSIAIATIGGFVYVSASALVVPLDDENNNGHNTTTAVSAILLARILSGCGAANSALGFAYVARTVPASEQTQTTALLSLCRIFGMAIGPGMNILVSGVDLPLTSTFKLDDLNSVGLVLVTANLISFLVIAFLLEEPDAKQKTTTTTTTTSIDEEQTGEKNENDEDAEDETETEEGLEERIKAATAKFGASQQQQQTMIEEEEEEPSWSEILKSFLGLDVLVPMLSIFTFNANFQLIETGFAPASHDALGWGPVQSSMALGSLSVIIAVNMMQVIRLSKSGVPDVRLLIGGLVTAILAYTLMYASWVKDTPVWRFVSPILVGAAAFPYLAPATRSIFTNAINSKPALRRYGGSMQAVLSMAASVAGFTTPAYVARYCLRSPEEVAASSDKRELTSYSLFAPAMSVLVLIGLLITSRRSTGKEDDIGGDDTEDDDDTEWFESVNGPSTEFFDSRGDDGRRSSSSSMIIAGGGAVATTGEETSLLSPPGAPKKKNMRCRPRRRSSTVSMRTDPSLRSSRRSRTSNAGIMLETTFEGLLDESIR